MRYSRLGHTELEPSILSLGTVALGMSYGITPKEKQEAGQNAAGVTPPTDKEAIRLIHRACDEGINFFDTARAYGRSEELLGKALQDRRDKVIIATKVNCLDAQNEPLHGAALRQQMLESISTSLKLLQSDRVDLLMLHSAPIELLEDGEALHILREFQAQGMTRYIGASTYGVEAPRLAVAKGFEALQVAFNILDQRMADEILPLAAREGVGIVARSIFLKGVLTPRAIDLPDRLAPLKQRSEEVRRIAASFSPPMTRVQAALRFVTSRPDVNTALVGVRSELELEASLEAVSTPLSPSAMMEFEQLRWDDPVMLDPGTWE